MKAQTAPSSSACHRRSTCRLCGSKHVELVLKLEPTPPANAFVAASERNKPQQAFPLDIFFCNDCCHVQMLDIVDPELLFSQYVYVSGTSPVFVKHFEEYAGTIIKNYALKQGDLVVDIGSNDGTLLSFFQKAGMKVLGIDPAIDIAADATKRGIETWNGFFDATSAKRIITEKARARVVTANNVFAHIDDLGGVVDNIKAILAPDGVFVFEVSYLVDVFEKTLFDTIYHEHLSYHSVLALQPFFAAHGMELIDAERVSSHGGSLRGTAQLKGGPHKTSSRVAETITAEKKLGLDKAETLKAFSAKIDRIGNELRKLLLKLKTEGKTIAAYGAPAKATTLMHHFQIGVDVIDFVVDDSPLKVGLFTPGMHIPVVSSKEMYERKPNAVVVLAWNFADSIIEKHKAFTEAGGNFIVPLPEVKIV